MHSVLLFIVAFYFGSLLFVAVVCSLWLLLFKYKRFPVSELADSKYCPFWSEIQYDMGLLTKLNVLKGLSKTPNIDQVQNVIPKHFVDIGSGSGTTSLLILSTIFGDDVKITLTDLNPNVREWSKLKSKHSNIDYIHHPVNLETIDIPGIKNEYCVSLINSLHHISEKNVERMIKTLSDRGMPIFIMDAKRLPFYHPLLVPFLFWIFYVFLAIIGRVQQIQVSPTFFLTNILIEPWIMSIDQMLGSARRYHMDIVETFAQKYNYRLVKDSDNLMNYILLLPKHS